MLSLPPIYTQGRLRALTRFLSRDRSQPLRVPRQGFRTGIAGLFDSVSHAWGPGDINLNAPPPTAPTAIKNADAPHPGLHRFCDRSCDQRVASLVGRTNCKVSPMDCVHPSRGASRDAGGLDGGEGGIRSRDPRSHQRLRPDPKPSIHQIHSKPEYQVQIRYSQIDSCPARAASLGSGRTTPGARPGGPSAAPSLKSSTGSDHAHSCFCPKCARKRAYPTSSWTSAGHVLSTRSKSPRRTAGPAGDIPHPWAQLTASCATL